MTAGRWSYLGPRKAERFDFVRFTCPACDTPQVQTVSIRRIQTRCIECQAIHTIVSSERQRNPY